MTMKKTLASLFRRMTKGEQPSEEKKRGTLRQLRFFAKSNVYQQKGFVVKQSPAVSDPYDVDQLAIPEGEFLWYGESQERFLLTGKRDAKVLRDALAENGFDQQQPCNFLEFGCANARVLRWFADWAKEGEGWGVDINSNTVFWCHENLSPPFHFAVSTTAPHLFFEDHFFGLVFCYSVFTHIDDMYLSWICELRRVIKPGGFLAITISDENSVKLEKTAELERYERIQGSDVLQDFHAKNADLAALYRDVSSQVTIKRDYAERLFSHAFEVVKIIEKTMGERQTLMLMRRR